MWSCVSVLQLATEAGRPAYRWCYRLATGRMRASQPHPATGHVDVDVLVVSRGPLNCVNKWYIPGSSVSRLPWRRAKRRPSVGSHSYQTREINRGSLSSSTRGEPLSLFPLSHSIDVAEFAAVARRQNDSLRIFLLERLEWLCSPP